MSTNHEVTIEQIGATHELRCTCGDGADVRFFPEPTLDGFARSHRIEGVPFARLIARTQ